MHPFSEYYLSVPGDITIGITSNQELPISPREELLLGAYLPDATLQSTQPGNVDIMLNHFESEDASLCASNDEIEIRDKWNETFPSDLPHLLYSIARGAWLERGYYPTHAACVGKDEFVLMPGHSGVGKTTVALNAATNYDQRILSGNTTLITFSDGKMQAVAGTKTMTLRTDDFAQGHYMAEQKVEYGNRTAFELTAGQYAAGPQTIGRIALVRLNDGKNHWEELSSLSALHVLFPYLVDSEYQDCIVANGRAIYLGGTPEWSREQLAVELHDALMNIPVYSGVGDKNFLSMKVRGS